jgi:hypothetical protein
MKKVVFALIALFFTIKMTAQESQTAYNFLRLPVSAHVAALGGENITITEDDPTLIFHNPALIGGTTDKSINLNYMTYMEGTKTASASFIKAAGERATWGVMAQYMDYGDIIETSIDGSRLGKVSAKDIMVGGSFQYFLGDLWSGGISGKFISSSLAGYSSAALAVDLGVNYYDEEKGWSLSAVAKNLGGQVKAYNDEYEKIPLDLQLGISKQFEKAPIRLSATMSRLNKWEGRFINHFALGADVFLSQNIYIAGGYNFRRADEMKISESEGSSAHGAGLSIGGGLQLQRFKLHLAYAKYHVSASSLLINVAYSL